MLARPGPVGVAVSGGADSVALLHALATLYSSRRLCVIHLNHCLRGSESDADADFVRELAARHGYECFVKREDVASAAESGNRNLEQAGRLCRYRLFGKLVADGACAVVATAHTRSDQAETVLLRLLRGAGGAGLSGIWPAVDGSIVRPMLDVSRSEVLDFLRDRGIAWREDPTNANPAFARNRLRHGLIPALAQGWNPKLEATLANTADWAVEEERYWQRRVQRLLRRCTSASPDGLLLDVKSARTLHPAELRRLVRSILSRLREETAAAGFGHVEAVRSLVASPRGTGGVDLPGARAERSFNTVRFIARPDRPVGDFERPVPVPGVVPLPGAGDAFFRTRVIDMHDRLTLYNSSIAALLDWDRVPGQLRLRNWRPGDRYRPAGMSATKKIKDLFQRERVYAWRRAAWPVVTGTRARSGRIVWARTFGPAHEFAARPETRRVLALDEVSAVC